MAGLKACRVEAHPYRGRWRWLLRETCTHAILLQAAQSDLERSRAAALRVGKARRVLWLAEAGQFDGRTHNQPPLRRQRLELRARV